MFNIIGFKALIIYTLAFDVGLGFSLVLGKDSRFSTTYYNDHITQTELHIGMGY